MFTCRSTISHGCREHGNMQNTWHYFPGTTAKRLNACACCLGTSHLVCRHHRPGLRPNESRGGQILLPLTYRRLSISVGGSGVLRDLAMRAGLFLAWPRIQTNRKTESNKLIASCLKLEASCLKLLVFYWKRSVLNWLCFISKRRFLNHFKCS